LLEAETRHRKLLSTTIEVDEALDPVAAIFASRLATDRWFCWEQPDRNFSLATMGSVAEVVSRGPDRFEDVAKRCANLLNDAHIEGEGPAGTGPVWTGGFAFAPEGGNTSHWHSFPPALMALPRISIVRSDEGTFMTVNAIGEPGAETHLATSPLPLLDPAPSGRTSIHSVRSPGEFELAVEQAIDRITTSALEKVVLAREVQLAAPAAYDPAAVFGALRELFPSCFCFCAGTPEAAFIGASPELLVRRSGASAATVALAGSTRRSSDPAVDDHLGEQLLRSAKDREEHAIVAHRIERSLHPHSVWVQAEPEPGLAKIANIQHLATPIHAQLAQPRSAVELAGILHPTPAVGGEPRELAEATIADLEQMDRGWYAGPVGWMDATEDGEFCVALRSALLRDRTAHLYAGAGLVATSNPAAELAETEIKLEAMLPLLSG
jgi:menaquinone-specific isochorismate synthase